MKSLIEEIKQLPSHLKKAAAYCALAIFICGVFLGAATTTLATDTTDQSHNAVNNLSEDEPTSSVLAVEITGQVHKPGVYELSDAKRAIELLPLAGGLTTDADLHYLHRDVALAERVSDGYKLFVPAKQTLLPGADSVGVSLNSATAAQLESLPGVGEATASAIIAARPFEAIEDLKEVEGIGDKTFERLSPLVSL